MEPRFTFYCAPFAGSLSIEPVEFRIAEQGFVEISSARQKTATHEGLRSRHVSTDPRRASAQRVSNDDPKNRIHWR